MNQFSPRIGSGKAETDKDMIQEKSFYTLQATFEAECGLFTGSVFQKQNFSFAKSHDEIT